MRNAHHTQDKITVSHLAFILRNIILKPSSITHFTISRANAHIQLRAKLDLIDGHIMEK